MRPLYASLMLLLPVLLLACGGRNYCRRNADAIESCGLSRDEARLEACEAALESCTKADEDLLDAWYDCTEDAGAYSCDATSAELVDALDCLGELDGLSDSCKPDQSVMATAGP